MQKQGIGGEIFALEKMYVPIHRDGDHWVIIEVYIHAKAVK
jgi:hypothetical protein